MLAKALQEHQSSTVQAVYHGFGTTVSPDKLVSSKGQALSQAISNVLEDPTFKASAAVFLRLGLHLLVTGSKYVMASSSRSASVQVNVHFTPEYNLSMHDKQLALSSLQSNLVK